MTTRSSLALSFALLIAAATWSTAPRAQAPPSRVTVFENARVIVGDGSAALENTTFVVDGTRFAAVGGSAAPPTNATRVDLRGKTVMPAIIDAHVHTATTKELLTQQLQQKAYFGSSAVLSLGLDDNEVAFEARQTPVPGGALLLTAGRGITMPEPGRSQAPYWVTSVADARKAVRELADKKVDIVKIWVDDRGGKYPKLTPELYGAVIDEAHARSLRVSVHVYYLEDAKGLLRAGVDAFAHGVRDKDVDEELLGLAKSRPQLVLVPNLPDRGVATDLGWLRESVPSGELQKLEAQPAARPEAQQAFGIQARNLAKMHAAGVKVALGTDGFVPWSHHVEMEDMVASGLTPAQVIVAATRNGAEFLRLKDRGTIAQGMQADFLVLDANPLEQITNTRRIASVYLSGAALDRAGMRGSWMAAGR